MKKLPLIDNSRSGMALVIVLGLISLLIISSVTFAILMRVERAGSANARNTMMARQIVKSALNNSIATIEDNIADNSYPQWYNPNNPKSPYWETKTEKTSKALGNARTIHYWKDTFASVDHNIGTRQTRAPAMVMTYAAERYLPYSIRHRAYARSLIPEGKSKEADIGVVTPEWIPVATDGDDENENIVGRYAFVAFNTTGYLDLAAKIAEYSKNGDEVPRMMGANPGELYLSDDFFRQGTKAKNFLDDNKHIVRYETVAEILDNNQKAPIKEGGNDSVFADGATFSAFSYNPKEYAPKKTDAEKDKTVDGEIYREKVYIGQYDPNDSTEEIDQLEHIKRHKARIMKAFYDSGLRKSSGEYKSKSISEQACDICGTAAYTLPAKCNTEQALWAYLGLLDYIDEDGKPAGDNDKERYARPATEATPLFTGFMVAMRLTRGDVVEEKDYELPSGATEKRKVVVQGKVGVSAEVVAKAVYTDRFGENAGAELIGDAAYESKIALWFDGGDEKVWKEGLSKYLEDEGLGGDTELDEGLLDDVIVGVLESEDYPDTPRVVMNFKYEDEVEVSGYPENSTGGNLEKAVKFPGMIFASAASQIEMPDGITQKIPAEKNIYENDGYDQWIVASVEPNEPIEINGDKVRINPGDSSATYQVKTNAVNLVIWGEMLDPRFLHIGAYEDALAWALPKIALVSNDQNEDGAGFLDDYEKFPECQIFDDMKALMENNDSFCRELKKFRDKDDYFIEKYFETEDIDEVGYYSQFHKLFLQNSEDILSKKDYFGGHVDGSHLGTEISDDDSDSKETDSLMKQWCTMHVKNGPLETVGELGHLPIGPWATIRLTGFNSEVEESKKFKADDFWNNFNLLPEVYSAKEGEDVTVPFHPVLDYFTTRGATRGLINLNSPDLSTLALAFNEMPLDTETSDAVERKKCGIRLSDSDAYDFASALQDSWDAHNADEDEPIPFNRLSQMGFAFESDPSVLDGVADGSNYYREAAIRNSCGLFTARGMTFTIIMRGEAFTPTFGRIAVSDESGTTHATRTAVAQIWRDTEKNEDGIYPFFIHFFKILDD